MWETTILSQKWRKQVKAFSTAKLKKNPKTINCKRSSMQLREQAKKNCSSEQEHKVNALALGAEEGRD